MSFPVTLNGTTYTLADFTGTAYVDGFPSALEDFVTHAGAIYASTSTTSNAIGTGSKTFAVPALKPYQPGTPLRIADAAAVTTNWIDAIVTSYSGTSLVVTSVAFAGSGTKSSWKINIGGGPIAYTGTLPVAQGGSGATSATAAASNLGVGTEDSPTFSDATLLTSDGGVLNLQTSEATIVDGDVLGALKFNAPSEGDGADGDARLVGAAIEAVAEGTFSDTNNATELVFKTGASEAAATKMTLSSAGDLTLTSTTASTSSTTGSLIVGGGVGIAADLFVGDDLDVTGDGVIDGNLLVSSTITASSGVPLIANVTSTASSIAYGGTVVRRNHTGVNQGNGIGFEMNSADGTNREYAYIGTIIESNANDGAQDGSIGLFPVLNNGRVQRFTVKSSGDCQINDGNLVVAAGHGIDFAATSGPTNGSSASELLSDYEHGSWSPVANAANSTPTVGYSARRGTYIKIGNMVTIFWDFTISSISGASGGAQITGLPYSATSNSSTMAGYSAMGSRSYSSIPANADSVLAAYIEGTTIHHEYDAFGAAGFGTKSAAGAFQTGRSTGYFTYATITN